MSFPSSPKQPDAGPYISVNAQFEWYLDLLSVFFSEIEEFEKLAPSKNLEEINRFTAKHGFPSFEYVTDKISFSQRKEHMKNIFHIIMKVYDLVEKHHQVKLDNYKNHARVMEQLEDLPQYLMQKIDEDFRALNHQYPKINLPKIPYKSWPSQ